MRSEGCPVLSPRERLHHSASVPLHHDPGGGSRYENHFTETCTHINRMRAVWDLLSKHSYSHAPVIIYWEPHHSRGLQPFSMLQWAFSLSPSHLSLALCYRPVGVHCHPQSPSLTLLAICSIVITFFFFFCYFSLWLSHTHLFSNFHLISLDRSSYLGALPLLPSHTWSRNLSPPVSNSHLLPLLFFVSISFIININSLSKLTFAVFLSLFMCFPFMPSTSVPNPSNSLFPPIIQHSFSLLRPFMLFWPSLYFSTPVNGCYSFSSPPDPEQNIHELVYDLRSQCDAIRVTKTVRPYRMVICPVNENNAALMVSDGRVMLWELKAHAGKSAANPRYWHTHTDAPKKSSEVQSGFVTGRLKKKPHWHALIRVLSEQR